MDNTTQQEKTMPDKPNLFKSGQERLAIWREIRGIWKGRNPDPIEWLEQSREDAERELPPIRS